MRLTQLIDYYNRDKKPRQGSDFDETRQYSHIDIDAVEPYRKARVQRKKGGSVGIVGDPLGPTDLFSTTKGS